MRLFPPKVNGVVVIMDFDGLSLSQIVHFTPSYAAMILDWIQNCIPIRLKAIYIVNNSYIFNMLYAVFKPFIGAKLRKRVRKISIDFELLSVWTQLQFCVLFCFTYFSFRFNF